jgi:hypothetical protein
MVAPAYAVQRLNSRDVDSDTESNFAPVTYTFVVGGEDERMCQARRKVMFL